MRAGGHAKPCACMAAAAAASPGDMVDAVCVPREGLQRCRLTECPQLDGVIPAAAEEQVTLGAVPAQAAALQQASSREGSRGTDITCHLTLACIRTHVLYVHVRAPVYLVLMLLVAAQWVGMQGQR